MYKIKFLTPQDNDFKNVWRYSSSEEVSRLLTWKNYKTIESFREFFEQKYLKHISYPNLFKTILVDGKFAGTLHMLKRERGVMQIGYGIMPKLWGKGIGKSILDKICNYISNNFSDIKIIRADINKSNEAMKKILNNYGFIKIKELENNRISYEFNLDIFKFEKYIFENHDVEALFKVGNTKENRLSDHDYIISFYEETDIRHNIENIESNGFVCIDNPAPYHYFFESKFGEIVDTYLLASSILHASMNISTCVIDKSNFLSSKIKVKENSKINFTLEDQYLYFLTKIIDKFSNNKLVQVERNFSSLRNTTIIPMAQRYGEAEVDNITQIRWIKKANLYLAYKATFSELKKEKMKEKIQVLFTVLSNTKDQKLRERLGEIKNYVEWL